MAVQYTHLFTVTGRNVFPVDMLRYDMCWPVTSEDAVTIGAAIRRDRFGSADGTRSVRLMTTEHPPTDGRWKSFGWTVSDYSKLKSQ